MDGDIQHHKLTPAYQQLYRQLCEGVIQPDIQACKLLERTKRDLERLHMDSSSLLHRVRDRLEYLSESMHSRSIDWREEFLNIRLLAKGNGSRRNRERVIAAGQEILGLLAHGVGVPNVGEAVCQKLVRQIYQSNFGDVVLTPPDGISEPPPSEIKSRLKEVEDQLHPDLDGLGSQLSRFKEGESLTLRLPLRKNKASKIDDLGADITDVLK